MGSGLSVLEETIDKASCSGTFIKTRESELPIRNYAQTRRSPQTRSLRSFNGASDSRIVSNGIPHSQ